MLTKFKHQVKSSLSPKNFKKANKVWMFQILKKEIKKAQRVQKGNIKGKKEKKNRCGH